MKKIEFSPPYIPKNTSKRIKKILKTGWITTGKEVQRFENNLKSFLKVSHLVSLNSATAGMELALRLMDIGPGDEVITTAYTYSATAAVIIHTGAKPVFVDVKKDTFHIDIHSVLEKINEKTKAIITVDYGGFPVDYNKVYEIIESQKKIFKAKPNTLQEKLNRIVFISDSAHAFGAKINNKYIGDNADFTIFSFHAVKNLTTAEGGALILSEKLSESCINVDELTNYIRILSLHGQTKSAYDKLKGDNWRYDIIYPGYKMNLPDILAALGNEQLKIYEKFILKKRKNIFETYFELLSKNKNIVLPEYFIQNSKETSYHLFPIRIKNFDEDKRNKLIKYLKKCGISTNVHFVPLPMFTYYKKSGYDINNYPQSYNSYKNEISLPIYPSLKFKSLKYIALKINSYTKSNI